MTKTRLKSINRKGCFSTSISVQDPAVQSLVLRPVSRRLVEKSCLLLGDGLLEGELLLGSHGGHGAHHVGHRHPGAHQGVGGQGGGGGGLGCGALCVCRLLSRLRPGIGRDGVLGGQLEVVVDLLQLLQVILLQADEPLELVAVFAGAVQTVDHVPLLLLSDEQHAEDLYLALSAEVSRLRARPPVELELAAFGPNKLHSDHHLPKAPQQGVLHGLEQFALGDSDILGEVPREVNHRHFRLVALELVPLVPLHRHVVLLGGERPDVPLDVVAPALGLDPVDAARVDPDQVSRPLQEPGMSRVN